MRSIRRSETTCSSCSASSCTSAQLMPITCTRNSSTSRCRRSTSPASFSPAARQAHAAIRLVLGEPRLGQRLHHRRRGARRDAERRRRPVPSARSRRPAAAATGPDRSPSGSSRPCSTGACADIIATLTMSRAPIASRRRKASAATSGRSLRRSPIATISSPSCCRTARIGGGSGGWSAWRQPDAGTRALDLATGTGDIAFALRRSRRARRRARHHPAHDRAGAGEGATDDVRPAARSAFLVGDMLALPFPGRSFDLVTTGYGLRNVPDLAGAIDEIARVLKPGGPGAVARLQPAVESDACGRRYLPYLTVVGGALGLGPASRPGHVPVHSRVDSPVSRAPRRSRG